MSTETPEPTVTVTRYAVSCLPATHRDRKHYEVRVEYHPVHDRWYVADRWGDWLNLDGRAILRVDGRTAADTMPLEQALDRAKAIAPNMVVNGQTVADALRMGGAR